MNSSEYQRYQWESKETDLGKLLKKSVRQGMLSLTDYLELRQSVESAPDRITILDLNCITGSYSKF